MNDFEDLLNKRFPTGMAKDEEVIVDITFENAPMEKNKLEKNTQFASGNAQLRDFFEMVGFICESAMDDLNIQYLPYEQALLYKNDPDYKMNKNTIAYRVSKREHTDKMGYKSRNTTTLLDESEQHRVSRFTDYFTSTVEFCFMSTNYDDAWDMMDRFEEVMTAYYKHIRNAGVVDYWFEDQTESDPHIDFREVMVVFVLHYKVKTERNTVVTNESIDLVNIVGKIKHDRSNKQ